jgi:hypothetical protein
MTATPVNDLVAELIEKTLSVADRQAVLNAGDAEHLGEHRLAVLEDEHLQPRYLAFLHFALNEVHHGFVGAVLAEAAAVRALAGEEKYEHARKAFIQSPCCGVVVGASLVCLEKIV